MATFVLTGGFSLNVISHALDYFIEHADINCPLEREYVCAAANIKASIDEELTELRKRKQNSI